MVHEGEPALVCRWTGLEMSNISILIIPQELVTKMYKGKNRINHFQSFSFDN